MTEQTPAEIINDLRQRIPSKRPSGLTQSEVALMLGVVQSAVSAWMHGRMEMSRSVRLLAARLLEKS